MIFDPGTVLVLGAGASAPYRFPVANQLRSQIIQNIKNTSGKEYNQLIEAGFSKEKISAFHTDLTKAFNFTIDAFLEDRPSWREIGAFAIAQVLMPLETDDILFTHSDWYPKLYKELKMRDYSDAANVTAIVTLNYDRSIDHYLTETVMRTYEGATRERVLEKLATVRIIHVHGQLGPYPETPYVPERKTEDIKKGAQGISMIYDQHLEDSEAFRDAAQFIANAVDVLFLGFGYDQRTLKRLGVFNVHQVPTFYGTTRGMENEKIEEVRKMFKDRIYLDATSANTIDTYLNSFERLKLQKRQKKA